MKKDKIEEFKNIQKLIENKILLIFLPLILGLIIYYLEEANLITPGAYFGSGNLPSFIIGFFGLLLWFYSIPTLINRSYDNWQNKGYLWIVYLLLVIPFFYVGALFQIGLSHLALFTLYIGPFIIFYVILRRLYELKDKLYTGYFILLILILLILIGSTIILFRGNNIPDIKNWLRVNFFRK